MSEINQEILSTVNPSVEAKLIDALYYHLDIKKPFFWTAKIDTYKSVIRVYMKVTQNDSIIHKNTLQYSIYKDLKDPKDRHKKVVFNQDFVLSLEQPKESGFYKYGFKATDGMSTFSSRDSFELIMPTSGTTQSNFFLQYVLILGSLKRFSIIGMAILQ